MDKIEELEKEINDVEETLNNLKTKVEEFKKSKNNFEPTPKDWKPKDGEVYYYVNLRLRVCNITFDDSSLIDEEIIKYNRIFQSEEECQLYCDIQKAFRDNAKEFVNKEYNYFLYYEYDNGELYIDKNYFSQSMELYFDSEETIQNLVNKFGEENIKRYYLGVY